MTANRPVDIDEFIRNLHAFTSIARYNTESRFLKDATDKPISFVQMNLMRVLDRHAGLTVGHVARYMNVSYPAATKTVDKLVRLGFLRRKEDARDRRIARLHLTPAGQKTVAKYTRLKRAQVQRVVDRLGNENACRFNNDLIEFARAIVDVVPLKETFFMQCGAFDPEECFKPRKGVTCGYLDYCSGAGE